MKEQIEALESKMGESADSKLIQGYRREVIRLKNELSALLGTINEAQAEAAAPKVESKDHFNPDEIKVSTGGFDWGPINIPYDPTEENKELQQSSDWFDKWVANRQDGYTKAAKAAGVFGDAIGDVISSSIVDGEKFASVLARQVDRAVGELYRLAAGYVLVKAAKDSAYNPIGALVGLTAGFVALKVAFAAIQKNQAGQSSSYDRGNSGSFKASVSGTDLNVLYKTQNTYDTRTNTVTG